MSIITVTKNAEGKVAGLTEKDAKAFARFNRQLESLERGEIMTIEMWFPRNPKLHGRHFAILSAVFGSQEQFPDLDQFRMWAQVGAGHCTFVPGPTGRMVALPKSIKWSKMDDEEFGDHHAKVIAFLFSEHARHFLWPHLSNHDSYEMVDTLLAEFNT